MSNSAKIVQTLKKQLKSAGITYRALGKRLKLSESAVKQMFAAGNFSLKRLDQVCEVLDMDIGELVEATISDEIRIEEIADDLERELVRNPRLLLVAYCLVNYWTVEDILNRYAINEAAIIRILVKLDRMKLIELLPGNRVRLLISNSFKWKNNGPIESFFHTQVQDEFLRGDFQTGIALQLIKNGDITKKGQRRLIERMESVGTLFDEIGVEDRKFSPAERKGTTMILAIRDWEFTAFSRLERKRLAR
jgi:transcriptional regulator with XRE-family HTH domain